MKTQAGRISYFLIFAFMLTLVLGACATDTRTPTGAALLADVTVTPPPSPTSAVPRSTVTPPVVALTQAADRTPAPRPWPPTPLPCDKVDPRAPELCAPIRSGGPLTPVPTPEPTRDPNYVEPTATPDLCMTPVPVSQTWASYYARWKADLRLPTRLVPKRQSSGRWSVGQEP